MNSSRSLRMTNTKYMRKYPDGSEFSEIELRAGRSAATVDPAGALLSSWKTGDKDILYVGSAKKRAGIPLLFPYFGTSKIGRQHGFGRDSLWKTVNQSSDSLTLALTDKDIDQQAKKEYPYEFYAEMSVVLEKDGALTYSLKVKNPSRSPLPISPGLHPYWAIDRKDKNNVKTNIEGFDAAKIDWENSPPDNDFPFSGRAELIFPDRKIVIEDIGDVKTVKQMVIWSQTPQKPDCDFICFEPVCGLRGGIDSQPLVLDAGETWEMKIKFSFMI